MRASMVSEYRKIVTTRLWWILLLAMAGYMAFLGAVLAVSLAEGTGADGGPDAPVVTPEMIRTSVYGVAAAFGYVFPVTIGALSVTGEYRHRTITPTYLADPDRVRVLGAKLLAALPVGLAFGVVGTLATILTGAGVLAATGNATEIAAPETWSLAVRSVLALAVWACVGVGIGSLITNQVLAVIVILVYTQFVEAVLRLVLGAVGGPLGDVAMFLPGAAGEAATGGSIFSAMGMGDLLPWGTGLLVLLGYAVVLAAAGAATTSRRDVP